MRSFDTSVDVAEYTRLARMGAPWASLPRTLYFGNDHRVHHDHLCPRRGTTKPLRALHDKGVRIRGAFLPPCPDCIRPMGQILPPGVSSALEVLASDAKDLRLLHKALGGNDTLEARVAAARALVTVQRWSGEPRRILAETDPGFELATWARTKHTLNERACESYRERLARWVDGPLVKTYSQLYLFKDITVALDCKGHNAKAAGVAAMAWPQLIRDPRARWVLAVGPTRKSPPSWVDGARGAGFVIPLGHLTGDEPADLWTTFATLYAEGLDFEDAYTSARAITA